jgi:hypothetical protein
MMALAPVVEEKLIKQLLQQHQHQHWVYHHQKEMSKLFLVSSHRKRRLVGRTEPNRD